MSKNFSSIYLYDTLQNSFQCCCSYNNENILLGNNDGIFVYNIFTKTITQIYSRTMIIRAMAYYDGNIYYLDYSGSTSGAAYICKLNIDTLDITSIRISFNSPIEDYWYIYNDGTIKVVEDGIIFSGSRWYRQDKLSQDVEASQFIAIKIPFDLSSTTEIFYSSSLSNNRYNYPISSILTPVGDSYKIFWYSYEYLRGTTLKDTYAKQGYTTNMTPVLSLNTFDDEVGTFNAFEDSNNYYILTNKYLIELNKETETTRILRDNPTSLAPLHYAYVGNSVYGISGDKLIKLVYSDYDISYIIKSSDGSKILSSIYNSSPITKFIFSYDADNVVAELTTLSGVQYLYYIPEKFSNKYLVGYSLSPNAVIPNYNVNEVYNITIAESLTFYEVYNYYRPVSKTLQLELYKNSAEPNRLDKTNYLEYVSVLEGTFRSATSLTNPVITFQQINLPQFNYVYIPLFNRYYYVNDITSVKYGLWDLSLGVDVLMSFKEGILGCSGFIERNEFRENPLLIDKKRIIEQGIDVETNEVTNQVFFNPGDTDNSDGIEICYTLSGYKISSADSINT